MRIIAINGSPRKKWNTYILLEKCLDGAKEAGAETELVNLYDMDYKGCTSCFVCKKKGVTVTKCAMKDNLAPVLERICECDALVLGSPIYFASMTGEMRSFWERLLFPYSSYEGKPSSFPKSINTAFIYTMNVPGFALPLTGYNKLFKKNQQLMKKIFGNAEYLAVTSTYQFDDYSKYAMTLFDGEKRRARRENVFPVDCKKAFEMGKRLCGK